MRTIYTHAHTEEASELYLCDIKQPAGYIFSSNILNILYMFMYFETQLMLRARDPQIIRNPELPEFTQQLDQFKENSGRIITNMFNQFQSKGSIRCCMYSHNIFTYYSECWMQCYSCYVCQFVTRNKLVMICKNLSTFPLLYLVSLRSSVGVYRSW